MLPTAKRSANCIELPISLTSSRSMRPAESSSPAPSLTKPAVCWSWTSKQEKRRNILPRTIRTGLMASLTALKYIRSCRSYQRSRLKRLRKRVRLSFSNTLDAFPRFHKRRYSYAMRIFLLVLLWTTNAIAAETTVIADGQYVMADGDTLAIADQRVLQKAQRRAIEEAGVFLESTFYDYEKTSKVDSTQISSLEIRTLAAAITRTEVLVARRSFEKDRPNFFVRIRALVNLDQLQDAIRRWKSDRQFAEHFTQLQEENAQLKAQLRELQTRPAGVRLLTIEPPVQSG